MPRVFPLAVSAIVAVTMIAAWRVPGSVAGGTPSFDVGEDTVVVSSPARVEITGDFGTSRIAAFTLEITFDEDSIHYTSCEGFMTPVVQCFGPSPGVVRFAFATGDPDGVNGPVTIGAINFDTGPDLGLFDVELEVETLADADSNDVTPESLSNGAVTVLSETPGPTVTPAPLIQGDLNCDGQISGIDVFMLMRYVAGVPFAPPPGCPVLGDPDGPSYWGDVNCDGMFSTEDVLRVARYVAGVPLTPILDCLEPGAEY